MTGAHDDDGLRRDAEAVLETRRELGASYDAALVESFAERIEHAVQERVNAGVEPHAREPVDDPRTGSTQLVLGLASIGAGIPITAISASTAGLPGLLVAWAGIVGVNVAHGLRRH